MVVAMQNLDIYVIRS